jgi:hypothetical protein
MFDRATRCSACRSASPSYVHRQAGCRGVAARDEDPTEYVTDCILLPMGQCITCSVASTIPRATARCVLLAKFV